MFCGEKPKKFLHKKISAPPQIGTKTQKQILRGTTHLPKGEKSPSALKKAYNGAVRSRLLKFFSAGPLASELRGAAPAKRLSAGDRSLFFRKTRSYSLGQCVYLYNKRIITH